MCYHYTRTHACGHDLSVWTYCKKARRRYLAVNDDDSDGEDGRGRSLKAKPKFKSKTKTKSQRSRSRSDTDTDNNSLRSRSRSPSSTYITDYIKSASRRDRSPLRFHSSLHSPFALSSASSPASSSSSSSSSTPTSSPTSSSTPPSTWKAWSDFPVPQRGPKRNKVRVPCKAAIIVARTDLSAVCPKPGCEFEALGRMWGCCRCERRDREFVVNHQPTCQTLVRPGRKCGHGVCEGCWGVELPPVPVYNQFFKEWVA